MNINKLAGLIQQQFQQGPTLNLPHVLGANKKLENELLTRLDEMKTTRRKKKTKAKKKFVKHPKALQSDSDISTLVSPVKAASYSSDSRVDLLYQNASFKKAKLSKDHKKRQPDYETFENDSSADINNLLRPWKPDWRVMGDSVTFQQNEEICDQIGNNSVRILLEKTRSFQSDINKPRESEVRVIERSKTFPTVKPKPEKKPENKKATYIVENPDLRLRSLLQKILDVMADISDFIDHGEVEPDGNEDLERRRKRAIEFSTRFSRNYLYQLSRYISHLESLCKTKSPRPFGQRNSDIHLKLISSHQVILQSLQAYQKQMPTALIQLTFEKLSQLLTISLSLCTIHRSNINLDCSGSCKRENLIEDFESRINLLLKKISDISRLKSVCALFKSSTVNNTKVTLVSQRSKVPRNKKKDLNDKLSMYAVSAVNTDFWRKSAANLAKKKFNVCSRYKEAAFKHRPPPIEEVVIQPSKPKVCEKRSSVSFKRDSVCKPLNDDSIVTMVESDRKKENKSLYKLRVSSSLLDGSKSDAKMDPLKNLLNEFAKNGCNNGEVSQEYLQNVLTQLASMVQKPNKKTESKGDVRTDASDKENFNATPCNESNDESKSIAEDNSKKSNAQTDGKDSNTFKSKTEVPVMSSKKSQDKIVPPLDLNTHREQSKKTEKRSNLKVTGEKNAKLYYMVHDESEESPPENNAGNDEKCAEKVTTETQIDNDLREDGFESCQLIYKERGSSPISNQFGKRCTKINRMPKKAIPKKNLTLLPKDHMLNIVQYKLQYNKYSRKNHMYKKSTTVQPWILFGRISDKILDSVLFDIAREIEINDIIESLYRSEFQ